MSTPNLSAGEAMAHRSHSKPVYTHEAGDQIPSSRSCIMTAAATSGLPLSRTMASVIRPTQCVTCECAKIRIVFSGPEAKTVPPVSELPRDGVLSSTQKPRFGTPAVQ